MAIKLDFVRFMCLKRHQKAPLDRIWWCMRETWPTRSDKRSFIGWILNFSSIKGIGGSRMNMMIFLEGFSCFLGWNIKLRFKKPQNLKGKNLVEQPSLFPQNLMHLLKKKTIHQIVFAEKKIHFILFIRNFMGHYVFGIYSTYIWQLRHITRNYVKLYGIIWSP